MKFFLEMYDKTIWENLIVLCHRYFEYTLTERPGKDQYQSTITHLNVDQLTYQY